MITVTTMKKKQKKKLWVGILKNMGGNFLGRNFPCGSFPDAIFNNNSNKRS